jgi:dienelactone hydrolase
LRRGRADLTSDPASVQVAREGRPDGGLKRRAHGAMLPGKPAAFDVRREGTGEDPLMHRRQFLRSVPLAAAGVAAAGLGHAAEPGFPVGEPKVKRFEDQRWVLDNIIQANGVDWDQGHTGTLLRACGLAIQGDMAGLRQRVKKYADIVPAFEALARRREALAQEHEKAEELIPARDNYYIAAAYWGTAMWGLEEHGPRLRRNNDKKRETFSKYMALADHHIEWVEIPYRGRSLPAVLHLPPKRQAGDKVPVIVAVPGMDGFKERSVSLYADGWMDRNYAVLAIEGPGYWESPVRGIFIDVQGWVETGQEVAKWLRARPEIDPERIAATGSSFGSFFSAAMISEEPAFKACAVTGTCYDPGGGAIFDEASPTFKKRFMFMSGITDEGEFESFRKTLDWHGFAGKVKAPFLIAAGEADELCPLEQTEAFTRALGGPKQLVVYQDSRHSLNGASVSNGPDPRVMQAEWITRRLQGKPMQSERWYVENSGRVAKTALA